MSTFEEAAEKTLVATDTQLAFILGAKFAQERIAESIATFIPDMHEDDEACEDCTMVRALLKEIREMT